MADSVLDRFPTLNDRWSYDYGVIWKGLEKVYELTGDERYFNYIKENMDSFLLPDGSIRGYDAGMHNLDYINNGKTLLYLYRKTGDNKYAAAAGLLRKQLDTQPRNSLGGFWHKQVYPYQMWLDGLYMAEPFYAEYLSFLEHADVSKPCSPSVSNRAATDGCSAADDHTTENNSGSDRIFDDVILQFRLIDEHLKDPKTHLLYHGWDERRECFWADPETGLSANFWGRSIGWYACALVDTLDYLTNKDDRQVLISMVEDLAKALTAVRSPRTGVWYEVPNMAEDPANYPEASCSCMFTYFLLKAVRKGYISKEYYETAKKAFYSIIREFIEVEQDNMLTLKGTVYGAGLGGDTIRDGSYEYYTGEPRKNNHPLGIGPFLMAATELERSQAVSS